MMLSNLDLYFEKAWQKNWSGIDLNTANNLQKLGINIYSKIEKYNLTIQTTDLSHYSDDQLREMVQLLEEKSASVIDSGISRTST